jgi:hypothetical protein
LGTTSIRGGWKNTYHFKVLWQRLYQVIEQSLSGQTVASQWQQNVSTEKSERIQTVPTEQEQTVSTEIVECQQNVCTEWRQNAAIQYRDNTRENKEADKTDGENQATWQKAVDQVKKDLSADRQDLPLGETADRLIGTALLEVTETSATIFVPNRNALPWFERRLYGQIAKAIKGVVGKGLDL